MRAFRPSGPPSNAGIHLQVKPVQSKLVKSTRPKPPQVQKKQVPSKGKEIQIPCCSKE